MYIIYILMQELNMVVKEKDEESEKRVCVLMKELFEYRRHLIESSKETRIDDIVIKFEPLIREEYVRLKFCI